MGMFLAGQAIAGQGMEGGDITARALKLYEHKGIPGTSPLSLENKKSTSPLPGERKGTSPLSADRKSSTSPLPAEKKSPTTPLPSKSTT